MGIESNNYGGEENGNQNKSQTNHDTQSAFAGATVSEGGAPTGSMDFLTLSSLINVERIDPAVEPYLDDVMKTVQESLSQAQLIRLPRINNAYAVQYVGSDGTKSFFVLLFVSTSDTPTQNQAPASVKLEAVVNELKQRFEGEIIRVIDTRVVIAGYAPEMQRSRQMGDTIVRHFRVTSDRKAHGATVSTFTTNEFVADWRLSEARAFESALSPHGVRPRMDVAVVLKVKIPTPAGSRDYQGFQEDYRPVGVIGGYTEIYEREVFNINGIQTLLYRPVFNVTVCNSIIPLEGMMATLLGVLAPSIYTTKFWASQWRDLSEGQPNPGMLEEDPENRGRPFVLKNQDELNEFVTKYFAAPEIAFQFQEGRDVIPGTWRLGSPMANVKNHFLGRLAGFFEAEPEANRNVQIAEKIGTRSDGVYGDPSGMLHDSRNVDYLYIAAKSGMGAINADMRRVLLTGGDNEVERARLTQAVTNSFAPLYLDTIVAINADLVRWIISMADARNMVIVDPSSQTPARSLGSVLGGFGSSGGMGSMVTNGQTNRGLGLTSSWYR